MFDGIIETHILKCYFVGRETFDRLTPYLNYRKEIDEITVKGENMIGFARVCVDGISQG